MIHRGIIPILKLVMIVGSPENSMFASQEDPLGRIVGDSAVPGI